MNTCTMNDFTYNLIQLSELVCKEVAGEPVEEDQASVISYFIQTAKVSSIF